MMVEDEEDAGGKVASRRNKALFITRLGLSLLRSICLSNTITSGLASRANDPPMSFRTVGQSKHGVLL